MSNVVKGLSEKNLSSIFIYASLPERKSIPTFSRYPFLLGHVCSRWRRACFATPEISCSSITRIDDFGLFDLTAAQTYLSYVGPTLPLILSVHGCKDGSELREYRHVFEEFVARQATRWTEVEFFAFLQTDITSTLRGLTSLKTLSIVFPKEPLHEVTVEGGDWAAVLKRYQQSESITLPSLKHLLLDFRSSPCPGGAVVPILGMLTVPSLSHLTFYMSKDSGRRGAAWQLLGKMLARSKEPPLKTFYTSHDSHPTHRRDMKDFLEHVPYLERADTICFDYPLWDIMDERYPEPESKPDPALKVMRLDQSLFFSLRVWDLRVVLDRRWDDGEGTLTHVYDGADKCFYTVQKYMDMMDPAGLLKEPVHTRGRWAIMYGKSRSYVIPWDIN